MSISLYNPNDSSYLGDVASVHGWVWFCDWAEDQDGAIADFASTGIATDASVLGVALRQAKSDDPDVDEVRQAVADLCTTGAVVAVDGIE
jgi:hypothetical protein